MGLDDKMSNKGEDTKGKLKEKTGAALGNESMEAEGKGDQASASLKDGVEKLKDAAKDIKNGLSSDKK